MCLLLAAARKYALIICAHLLAVNIMHLLTVTASLSNEDVVYLIESVVRSLHICTRVLSPTLCKGLQLIREDRNDDQFC